MPSFEKNNFVTFLNMDDSVFSKAKIKELLNLIDENGLPMWLGDSKAFGYYFHENTDLFCEDGNCYRQNNFLNFWERPQLGSYVREIIDRIPKERLKGVKRIKVENYIFDDFRNLLEKYKQNYLEDLLSLEYPPLRFHRDCFGTNPE